MSYTLIIAVGLLAQGMFSARLIVQWIASERARKVLSPVIFWQLSMAASFLLCLYGWLRDDPAIIMGQFVSYYIYIWNLKAKGSWITMNRFVRFGFGLLPVVAVICCISGWRDSAARIFDTENMPLWLMTFGIAGQFVFTLRFVVQWWCSHRIGESVLPPAFWMISLGGSAMIIIYAVLRHDPVLIIGQSTGFVVYIRNLMIGLKNHPAQETEAVEADRSVHTA